MLAHVPLHRGIDVRVRAHGARELADRDRVAGAQQALAVAANLQRPERQLHAERRRLGVDAVGAADHRRVAELAGAFAIADSRRRPPEDAIEGARHLERERGVDHVARREPVVHPRARGLADARLHDVDERGDVVIGDALAFVYGLDVETRARV